MQYVPRNGKDQNEEVSFAYSQMDFLISEFVTGRKAKRNREILRDHFLDGYTCEEIAARHDMSPVQIWRIIHKYGDPLLLMIEK